MYGFVVMSTLYLFRMNFNELLKKLQEINLPVDQFVVVSSGSLAARGIREARDLDILVSDDLWAYLSKKYPIKNVHGVDKIEVGDSIEIVGKGSSFIDPEIATIEEVLTSADVINGVRFINLKLLRRFKEKMGREKDKIDIQLISNYLSQQNC